MGVGNILRFDLLNMPDEDAFAKALEILYSLKIVDAESNLTADIGLKVCDLALDARLGVMLINSFKDEFACSEEMVALAAMLSV